MARPGHLEDSSAGRAAGYQGKRRVHGTSLKSPSSTFAARSPRGLAALSARALGGLALLALSILLVAGAAEAQAPDAFRRFLETLWPEAQTMGVSRATFDAALRGVEPDLALPDLVLPGKSDVKGQAEFTRTPAQYLSASYLAKL